MFSGLSWVSWVVISLVALGPIIAWGLFFQHEHRTKASFAWLALVAGMASIIPIKLYEKYWHQGVGYFEHSNLFNYLETLVAIPNFSHLLSFLLMSVIVSVGILIFTAFLIFWLEVLLGHESPFHYAQKMEKVLESPFLFVFLGLIVGLIAYSSAFQWGAYVWTFIMVGMMEEYVKYLVLRLANDDKIKTPNDVISFAIMTALGFAFIENIIYFARLWEQGIFSAEKLTLIVALRSTVSVLAHVGFSVIFAHFYALSRFSSPKSSTTPSIWSRARSLMHRIMHGKEVVLWHEQIRLEGMILAVLCHMLFNLLLELGHILWAIALVLVMTWMVMHWLHQCFGLTFDPQKAILSGSPPFAGGGKNP